MSVELRPGDITAIAARIPSADPITAITALRNEVNTLCEGGHVPALSREEYANALLKLAGVAPVDAASPAAVRASVDSADRAVTELNGAVRTERRTIASLDAELANLQASNQRLYDASVASFTAIQNQLCGVLTNSRTSSDNRADAFFRISANSNRMGGLSRSFAAYKAKQAEFKTALDGLRAREQSIPTGDAGGGDVLLTLVQRQVGLKLLIDNLKEQSALLRTMVSQASGTNNALQAVDAALVQETARCAAFVDAVTRDSVTDLLGRVTGLALFAASILAPGPIAVAAGVARLLQEILLKDVAGVRDEVESLVWSAVGRFVTAGLVDAGLAEPWAHMLVAGVRASAGAVAEERANASAVVTDAVRAGLNAAQLSVVDFLLTQADPALPLASLVRHAISLSSMTDDDATRIRGALTRPAMGIDDALALLARS